MVDEMKKTEGECKSQLSELCGEGESYKEKFEFIKKDNNKKFTQIYREIEKFAMQLERKLSVEDFNEKMESKCDKLMLANSL